MSFNKSKITLAIAAAAGLTFSAGAYATNGIIQAGNGMVAHGLGGAGLSNAGEAAAGMDNPALISQTGDSVNVAWSMFMPERSWTYTPAAPFFESNSDAKMFGIPQIAFTSKINDSMSWGIMAYAMGGMNTDYRMGPPAPTPTWFLPQSVDLAGMIIAPTMSFALNKDISLGASLLIGYETLRGRNMFGLANTYYLGSVGASATNEGSTMAYGVKLGGNFQITDGISVGAMLQPKMVADEISWFKNLMTLFSPTAIDAELVLPNEAGVGGKFAVGKNVDIVADIMYYQWTSVDVFEFFGWDDQIVYKVGVEFRPSDKLALRAGLNYGESPIKGGTPVVTNLGVMDAAYANYLFPAVSTTHLTLGTTYNMDKNASLSAYYLYSPENKEEAVGMPFSIQMSQNAFGFGINYKAK